MVRSRAAIGTGEAPVVTVAVAVAESVDPQTILIGTCRDSAPPASCVTFVFRGEFVRSHDGIGTIPVDPTDRRQRQWLYRTERDHWPRTLVLGEIRQQCRH